MEKSNNKKGSKPIVFFDNDQFLKDGSKMLKLITDLKTELDQGKYSVTPKIKPGDIRKQLPTKAPEEGEDFDKILEDTKNIIFPGMTHWGHPSFFSYFPSNTCSNAVISELFKTAFHNPGFDWKCSPANTELETMVCDWVVKAIGLDDKFLFTKSGGGSIINTISEGIWVMVHSAKKRKMNDLKMKPNDPNQLKFVGYYTEFAHSCFRTAMDMNFIVEKRMIKAHYDRKNKIFNLNLDDIEKQLKQDIADGLIPFFFGMTIGGTGLGLTDPITDIMKILENYDLYTNVDAAWAGIAFFCPEYRQHLEGLKKVNSFFLNFGKWGMGGMPGAMFFHDDRHAFVESMGGHVPRPQYLKMSNIQESEFEAVSYKDWQVGLGRVMSSVRIWYVLRGYGIKGMQQNVREKVNLAQKFEQMVHKSKNFDLVSPRQLALVIFRYTGGDASRPDEELNDLNEKLLNQMTKDTTRGFFVSGKAQTIIFLRFVVCNHTTTIEHIQDFFNYLEETAATLESKDEDVYSNLNFRVYARGEFINVALVLAKVKWSQETVSLKDWKSHKKAETPNGFLPVLTINDGKPMDQLNAVMHYLCEKFGWVGKTFEDNYAANRVFDFVMDDCRMYTAEGFSLDTEEERIEWYAQRARDLMPGFLEKLNKITETSIKKNGWAACDYMTQADIVLLAWISKNVFNPYSTDVRLPMLEKYPTLLGYWESHKNLLVDYMQNRRPKCLT